jgi:hypothetical protein
MMPAPAIARLIRTSPSHDHERPHHVVLFVLEDVAVDRKDVRRRQVVADVTWTGAPRLAAMIPPRCLKFPFCPKPRNRVGLGRSGCSWSLNCPMSIV